MDFNDVLKVFPLDICDLYRRSSRSRPIPSYPTMEIAPDDAQRRDRVGSPPVCISQSWPEYLLTPSLASKNFLWQMALCY